MLKPGPDVKLNPHVFHKKRNYLWQYFFIWNEIKSLIHVIWLTFDLLWWSLSVYDSVFHGTYKWVNFFWQN